MIVSLQRQCFGIMFFNSSFYSRCNKCPSLVNIVNYTRVQVTSGFRYVRSDLMIERRQIVPSL